MRSAKKTIVFFVLKALRKVHKQLEYSSFYRQKAPREIHKKFELGILFSKPLGLVGRGVIKFFFFPLLAEFVKSVDGISIENATLWKEKDRMFYCSQKITKGNVNSVLIEGKIEYTIHETWEQKRALTIIREGKNHIFSTGPSSRVPLEYRVRALVSHLTSVALAGIRVAKILCWWKRDASKESSRKNI